MSKLRKYKLVNSTKITGDFVGFKALSPAAIIQHQTKEGYEPLVGQEVGAGVEVDCEFTLLELRSGSVICFIRE